MRKLVVLSVLVAVITLLVLSPLGAQAQGGTTVYEVGVPVCTVSWFPSASLPSGWLSLVTPDELNPAVYPELFACLGYTYGNIGGWFALPDVGGRFVLGARSDIGFPLGVMGGEISHTLTIPEMPSHSHDYYYFSGGTTIAHALVYTSKAVSFPGGSFIKPTGGDQPHNNMPPYVAFTPAIKARPTLITVTTGITSTMDELWLSKIFTQTQSINAGVYTLTTAASQTNVSLATLNTTTKQISATIGNQVARQPVQNSYVLTAPVYGAEVVTGYQSLSTGEALISALLGLLLVIEVLRLIFRGPRGLGL